MSWAQELSSVYDKVIDNEVITIKPLPLYHICNNAPLTVTLDGNGNFRYAQLLDKAYKKLWQTCMPCTEESAERTNNCAPYPLSDKLEYVAGDYILYAEAGKNLEEKYNAYFLLLESWALSHYSNAKIKSIYEYVKKKTLAKDLMNNSGILALNSPEKISMKENNVFVRWEVEIPGENAQTWLDAEIQKWWILFYTEMSIRPKGFCYASGSDTALAKFHPKKIRHPGDKAKLISSNDEENYTFRGRFTDAAEACQVGIVLSQKAHNALRWLIEHQGAKIGNGLTVIAWCSAGMITPRLLVSTNDITPEDFDYTPAQDFAKNVSKRLRGYYADLSDSDKIIIMALNAATPGRMSLLLYRELSKTELLEAQEQWHTHLAWFLSAWKKDDNGNSCVIHTISAPSPRRIAFALYGKEINKASETRIIERLLPCIIDKLPIPRDIENLCFKRASRLGTLDKSERKKTVETACAVIRYNAFLRPKEDYVVGLDEERTTRDYLYGRLLGVADMVEMTVLKRKGEDRMSNAVRYMTLFSRKPCSTWETLHKKLIPYLKQLNPKSRIFYIDLLGKILYQFDTNEFNSDAPLQGEYLLGYYCQQHAFWVKRENRKQKKQQNNISTKDKE